MLVDIQSRLPSPLLVNLAREDFNLIPGLKGSIIMRTMQELDPVSGEYRAKDRKVHCAPAITFPARGGVVKGLPAEVLRHPVIAAMLARGNGRQPKLVVVRQYEPDVPVAALPVDIPQPRVVEARAKKSRVNSDSSL